MGEEETLALAVRLVLECRPEEAVEVVSRYYGLRPPRVRVGLPKRCRRALGCYVPGERTIYLRSSREYCDPFVVLHELYHHLRHRLGRHRGTEKHADRFALKAIEAYQKRREPS